MLSLKKRSDPYLHSLFKTALIADAEEVKRILARKVGGKLLEDYDLVKAYEEAPPLEGRVLKIISGKIGDVIWVIKRPDSGGAYSTRIILHEIKTGQYDIVEVVNRYSGREYIAKWRAQYRRPLTSNSPLFIWSWKRQQAKDDPVYGGPSTYVKNGLLLNSYFRAATVKELEERGALRQLPLGWLFPIVNRRLEELFEFS
jgi:hypothetical protein